MVTDELVDQMRKDFALAARAHDWSDADQKEIRAEITRLIEADDEEALQGWAKQFAAGAAWWRQLMAATAQRLRAFEARVKEEARAAAAQDEERQAA